MVQRSTMEDDSKKEYEEVLAQQRQLYEVKTAELDKVHAQRKVRE